MVKLVNSYRFGKSRLNGRH